MLLEIKCSSCGESKYMILDVAENGSMALFCKNPNCEDFNCFIDFNVKYLYRNMGNEITIKEAYTGEVEYENEDGKFKEIYNNGECTDAFKFINEEWIDIDDLDKKDTK